MPQQRPLIERFWEKVHKTRSCWLWTASTISGYGQIQKGGKKRCPLTAHRLSWEIHFGPIPKGMWVLHNCPGGDNKLCVNPKHLWLGTAYDNNRDMILKGRHSKPPVFYGAANRAAKITEDVVRQIRQLSRDGTPQVQIARIVGLKQPAVSLIILRKTWKHVN